MKLKASKDYCLAYDINSNCFRLLEFDKKRPFNEGCCISTIPHKELIDLVVEYWKEE